ncbi:MAG: hypothetical protein AB1894_11635 [Chloroflexota bacterium]
MLENVSLPEFLKPHFWDCDFSALSWTDQRDFVIRRLLQSGNWQALTWLRLELGDAELRRWIEQRRGAGLSPRQLRFWEAVLEMPHAKVTRWVHDAARHPWERRLTGS